MASKLDISVVVPLYNERESLPELMAWIDRVCSGEKLSYEVIMVDDGSNDGSWGVIEQLKGVYGEKLKAFLIDSAQPILGEAQYPNDKTGWGRLCVNSDSL